MIKITREAVKFTVGIVLLTIIACTKQTGSHQFGNIALAEGDLIFRKGIGAKSRAVLNADSAGIYSHSGIIVRKDSGFYVVHITPGERKEGERYDKIKAEPIGEFWSKDKAQNGAIYRLKNNAPCSQAGRQALRLLQKGILFDHDYELGDTTQMYCTELIWYVYRQAGIDITHGKRSRLNVPLYSGTYIFPSDIYKNKDFQLIYKF